jgi:pimeloyl-ACP methyl ester carboxylesterase
MVTDHFPLLVAHSLGADLAVWYAAAHPGTVAGIFLIDGALPANLIDDPDEMKRQLNTPVVRIVFAVTGILHPIGMGYWLSGDNLATINIELNARRQQVLEAYAQLDCPVEMVLASHTAGEKGARAQKMNPLWRAGVQLLAIKYPTLPIHWLDSTHLLPLTKPTELAEALDDFARRVKAGDQALAHDIP